MNYTLHRVMTGVTAMTLVTACQRARSGYIMKRQQNVQFKISLLYYLLALIEHCK